MWLRWGRFFFFVLVVFFLDRIGDFRALFLLIQLVFFVFCLDGDWWCFLKTRLDRIGIMLPCCPFWGG